MSACRFYLRGFAAHGAGEQECPRFTGDSDFQIQFRQLKQAKEKFAYPSLRSPRRLEDQPPYLALGGRAFKPHRRPGVGSLVLQAPPSVS